MSIQISNRSFAGLITVLFFAVALTGAFHHEPWRDEIQAWLIAINANSLSGLYENCLYEGHPMLWHLLLYVITRFSNEIFYMQLLSVLIASAAVYLFCMYSPFTRLQKMLWSVGLFPLYQYCIVSRSYCLILLFTIAFMVCYAKDSRSFACWLILSLMANVSATGVVLSLCFASLQLLNDRMEEHHFNIKAMIKKIFGAGAVVFVISVLLAVWQIIPEHDSKFLSSPSPLSLLRAISKLYDSFGFVSDIPMLSGITEAGIHIVLAVLLFMLICILIADKPVALLFYVLSIGIMMPFLGMMQLLSDRFTGHYYLIFIASLWLAAIVKPGKPFAYLPGNENINRTRWLPAFFSLILICQVISGLRAFRADYNQVFSANKQTAEYITDHHYEDLPIIGAMDYAVSPLSGWLNKAVFYPETQSYGTFIQWNQKRQTPFTSDLLLSALKNVLGRENRALVILSVQITGNDSMLENITGGAASNGFVFTLIKKTGGALIGDENYNVYLAERKFNLLIK